MKILPNLFKAAIWVLLLTAVQSNLNSQGEANKIVKKPLITLKYFNVEGQAQYLKLQCLLKVEKNVEPINKLGVKIYLDDEADEKNLIGKFITNEEGKAETILPIAFKEQWIHSYQHKFIAVTDSISGIGVRQAEAEITIARMSLDTVAEADARKVIVRFEERKDSNWAPVKDVEIKLGIKRLGSQMPLGESETVTTDSTGTATAEFTKDSLPGDKFGNLILIAKVEDHDVYGNVEAVKSVSWGNPLKYENNFDKRSLWATGFRVPLWLLFIACFIIISVWSTLVYLVFRIIKIRKLGLS